RMRCEGPRPMTSLLGVVLQEQRVGGRWQVVVREPDRQALERLRTTAGVSDYDETPLGLEEIYCALFAREASKP
ncbi:MAG TPA: hypothetical protein VHR72_05675, partial [Gemmataceae bacterium]|nr:hypothetical protein [Gemmataceae bacterium]